MSLSSAKFDPVIFDELIFDCVADQALMYALSNVARSDATRSNYHSPKCFVSINGTFRESGVKYDTIVVDDVLNEVANTATLNVDTAVAPAAGQEVIITLGSKNNRTRIFGGYIVNQTLTYEGVPSNAIYQLALVDYTWQLNKRKVNRRYTNESATAIAVDLIESFTTGFTTANVAVELATIDEITFTNEDVTDCLTRLANRFGGYWYLDYLRDLHFFVTETTQAPQTVSIGNPSLRNFLYSQDISQFVTRVYGEGGGVSAITEVAPGETIVPVEDAIGWYNASGGIFASGPQRCTYSGYDEGGEGSLVGPGAGPTTAVTLSMAAGAGVTTGYHDYAVTFVTGAGESIAGPLSTIYVGSVDPPSTAPTVALAVGAGVTTGSHYYAVTFVAGGGETHYTTLSFSVTTGPVTTGTITAPSSAPSLSSTGGTGNNYVSVTYAVTFYNGVGETTSGPSSTDTLILGFSVPSASLTFINVGSGSIAAGSYTWYITGVNGSGAQTEVASLGGGGSGSTFDMRLDFSSPTAAGGYSSYRFYRTTNGGSTPLYVGQTASASDTSFTDNVPDGSLGVAGPTINSTYEQVALSSIPIGGAGTTGRKVYATVPSGSQLKLLTTIANNSATTYTDTNPWNQARLGANVPTSNTTGTTVDYNQVSLTAIPIGPSAVTARKIYRTTAGGSQLKLLATIADNVTTTYTDSTADGALGANVPTTNTSVANQVSLTAISVGPSGTTQRKIYRTIAGGAQLKLLTTIADNTTTTYTDSSADAALGANVPTSDTSGLTQEEGQVLAGSTSIPVAGAGAFPTTGWAIIGNGTQVVRYTGKSSVSLTGIPASGAGSITATIAYNSNITAAPQLTGVPATGTGAIVYSILKGDPVNVLVQRDDIAAQSVLATIVGGDGIQEAYISDNRRSEAEMVLRADAYLTKRADYIDGVEYQTHDLNSRSGYTATVSLGAPLEVADSFLIQRVVITGFEKSARIMPWFAVQASSERFSFEDLVRRERNS